MPPPPRKKNQTYQRYAIEHPDQNTGQTQTCELDHLISLELGGADTVDNIWPQCGPPGMVLSETLFQEKRRGGKFPAKQVREGKMSWRKRQRASAQIGRSFWPLRKDVGSRVRVTVADDFSESLQITLDRFLKIGSK